MKTKGQTAKRLFLLVSRNSH